MEVELGGSGRARDRSGAQHRREMADVRHAGARSRQCEIVARRLPPSSPRSNLAVAKRSDPRLSEPADYALGRVKPSARFGRLDILVTTPALRDEAPFPSLRLERWRAVLQSVLDGAFLCSQTALPHCARAARSIVNIADSPRTRRAQSARTSLRQGGLVGFTRGLRTISRATA